MLTTKAFIISHYCLGCRWSIVKRNALERGVGAVPAVAVEVVLFLSSDTEAQKALEAVKGVAKVNEIAQRYGVHPAIVQQWKREFLDNASTVFATKRGPSSSTPNALSV